MRRHVQGVRRGRCELRAAGGGEDTSHGQFGIVVAVDYVMRNARVVWILRLKLFQNIGCLELITSTTVRLKTCILLLKLSWLN